MDRVIPNFDFEGVGSGEEERKAREYRISVANLGRPLTEVRPWLKRELSLAELVERCKKETIDLLGTLELPDDLGLPKIKTRKITPKKKRAPDFNRKTPEQKAQKLICKYEKDKGAPEQPTPITADNFHIRTKGVWDQVHEIPEGFTFKFKSRSKSSYYINEAKTHIVRVSDHWGKHIKYCNWHLKQNPNNSYEEISSFQWHKKFGKDARIGIIHISNFSVNANVFKKILVKEP